MIRKRNRYKESYFQENENKIYGVVTAIVTNNKDPENMARIKVKFPWMGEAKDKDSNWVRIATMMGGKERGSYFIPEVEDEVLIAFENGDVNAPYMIGALWNGKDTPTHTNNDGKNDIRCITSRSGHTLTFDDKDGEEVFELMDKSKKRRLTFKTKENKIEIINESDDGEIKIYSKGKMTIESDDELSIKVKKEPEYICN
ncbi:MAG: phage baseplate assembly protein V [Sulfurovum sp.]|nr:phage baseplate assembly protein V [Sulfurovum sp.]